MKIKTDVEWKNIGGGKGIRGAPNSKMEKMFEIIHVFNSQHAKPLKVLSISKANVMTMS